MNIFTKPIKDFNLIEASVATGLSMITAIWVIGFVVGAYDTLTERTKVEKMEESNEKEKED